MKTAVIYARYSSERQTEQSIEGQLHVCNDYAKRNDLVIVGTYIDRAMTGTNDNREDFQRMLKDSDKKSFDYVLVITHLPRQQVEIIRRLTDVAGGNNLSQLFRSECIGSFYRKPFGGGFLLFGGKRRQKDEHVEVG